MRNLTLLMKKDKKKQTENSSEELAPQPGNLWRARVISTNDFEFCSPSLDMEIAQGDFIIMLTRYGMDLAQILGPVSNLASVKTTGIRRIVRIASEKDLSRFNSLEKLGKKAFEICSEKISELKLAMKLVSSHYTFDERKILFFFTAENRVDFRELVRLLATQLKKRIELRQIEAREETRVVGGVAVCGRLYCCHSITDQLAAVSIKMAKVQNLSLNLLKASGPCNRLLCCLSYELENYTGERKLMPRRGARIAHEGVIYEVGEVNMLSRRIQLFASGGRRICVSASSIVKKTGGGWKIRSDKVDELAAENEGI